MSLRKFLGACAFASFTCAAALAQSSNYMSIEAVPGAPVQLTYHASARSDCTPAPLPTFKVIEVPKLGILTVRRATITTDKFPGCGQIKVPGQVVFYEARASDGGTDHVSYEVTGESGEVATYEVTVTVKPGPVPSPNPGTRL
jgi:hypothetical protein